MITITTINNSWYFINDDFRIRPNETEVYDETTLTYRQVRDLLNAEVNNRVTLSAPDKLVLEQKLERLDGNLDVSELKTINGSSLAGPGNIAITVNSTDAQLRDRATHTGTQLAATVSDFAPSVRSTALTGLSTATATPITATDTVLEAAGKLQRQATDSATLLPQPFNAAWYKSGLYYDAVYPYYMPITSTARGAGSLYFNKRKILDDVTFDEMLVNVTTAVASSTVFYGIYASGADGLPTTLLAAGSASGDTTGVKSTAITLALTKGQVVWDAVLTTGGAPSLSSFEPIFQDGAINPTANGTVGLYRSAQTSLPADASVFGGLGTITATRTFRIALRAA